MNKHTCDNAVCLNIIFTEGKGSEFCQPIGWRRKYSQLCHVVIIKHIISYGIVLSGV